MADLIAGKYEIIATIGKGGMGTVYKARQTNLDRIVAIKMLSEDLASDAEFRARFQQEATVVAKLNHPNIVQIHDIVSHNNTFCIIMEYLEGENLQAKIDRDVTVPEKDLILIGAQIARALGYAHEFGIVHRDIKPDNIHVLPNGIAKVMDFGIARFLDSKLKTQTGISMGTPKFMSPEQVTGKNVDGQTDLYSLGVCLYYCLTGSVPFDGDNAISVATRHLYEQPEPISKANPSVSPETEKIVMKALEKQKVNRYLTGVEMAAALENSLGIKTPIRVSDDGVTAHYAGTTQRVPMQSYGVSSSDVVLNASGDSPDDDSAGEESNNPGTDTTGLSPRFIRHLTNIDNFKTPGDFQSNSIKDPTKQFRFSIKMLGIIGILGTLFIIALIITLNSLISTEQKLPDAPTNHSVAQSNDNMYNATELQAKHLLEQKRVSEARHLWLSFQSKHPGIYPDKVNEQIDKITAQLPLSETTILAERRKAIGLSFLNKRPNDTSLDPIAFAYLNGAVTLNGERPDDLTTGILKMLRDQNIGEPDSERISRAAELFDQAVKLLESNSSGSEVESRLLQAVSLDYRKSDYWVELADYYQSIGLTDNARVMYSMAVKVATLPEVQAEIAQKLEKISSIR